MRTQTFIATVLSIMLLTGCMTGNNTASARDKKGSIAQTMLQFKGIDDVEYIEISGPLLGLGKLLAKDALDDIPVKHVKGICILEAEGAADNVRQEILDKIGKALDDYEIIMSAKDDGDDVSIYAKTDGDKINELVLFVKSEATVIALNGNISFDEISAALSE